MAVWHGPKSEHIVGVRLLERDNRPVPRLRSGVGDGVTASGVIATVVATVVAARAIAVRVDGGMAAADGRACRPHPCRRLVNC